MLGSLVKAPGFMLQHVNVYIALLLVTLVHGLLYWANSDLLATFVDGTVGGILWSTDTLLMARAVVLIVLSLALTIFSMALVARSFISENYSPKNSLFFSSLAFAIVLFAVMMGTYFLVQGIAGLASIGGIFSWMIGIAIFLIGMVVAIMVIKFSFTPVYMGRGFLPKDALTQSWRATKGKALYVIVLLIVLLVVTGLLQAIALILTEPIQNETYVYVLYLIFSSIGLFYSSSVLGLAAPATGMGTLSVHAHRKK